MSSLRQRMGSGCGKGKICTSGDVAVVGAAEAS